MMRPMTKIMRKTPTQNLRATGGRAASGRGRARSRAAAPSDALRREALGGVVPVARAATAALPAARHLRELRLRARELVLEGLLPVAQAARLVLVLGHGLLRRPVVVADVVLVDVQLLAGHGVGSGAALRSGARAAETLSCAFCRNGLLTSASAGSDHVSESWQLETACAAAAATPPQAT